MTDDPRGHPPGGPAADTAALGHADVVPLDVAGTWPAVLATGPARAGV
ncbi:hypothetical protein ACFXGA_21905 [Actinosynnema sp. NPDC059335]